jgi:hypothetical protein
MDLAIQKAKTAGIGFVSCRGKYYNEWLYGSWIYIYLSIQFLSPLKFRSWQFVFCTTLCNTRLSMTCSGLLVFSRNSGSSTDKPFASTWVHSRDRLCIM